MNYTVLMQVFLTQSKSELTTLQCHVTFNDMDLLLLNGLGVG